MGTTSEKLTYLNTTKGKIKDSINLTGANITTEPFRQYSTKLKEGYVDIINNGTDTLYNNFPKVSGEGTSLTLNNTYQAPMRNNLKGNTSQTGTPTPTSPIPVNVVSGDNEIVVNSKNQLETYNISGTLNGVNYTLQDGVLTLNGTCTASGALTGLGIFRQSKGINYKWTYVYESGTCTDYGGGLFLGATPTSTTSAGYGAGFRVSQSRTVGTFNNGEEHIYYLYITLNTNSTYTNYKVKPLIVQGNDYSYDFEPYQGNTYNIDLPVENLFDISKITENTYLASDGSTGSSSVTNLSDYMQILPSKPCTISYTYTTLLNSSVRAYCWYTENKTYIRGDNYNPANVPFTLTAPSNAKYIRFAYDKNCTNIQLQQSSKATPYGTTPIELCKIGNYQDYFAKSDGRNLFNGIYYYTYTGGSSPYPYASAASTRSGVIKVEPNTTYTISKEVSNRFRISEYTEQPVVGSSNAINYIYPQNEDSITSYTLTTQSNTQYLVVQVTNSSQENIKMQVEKGSIATPWQPFGVGKWYLHKEIGKVVLNGSEEWTGLGGNAFYTPTQFGTYNTSVVWIIADKLLGIARDNITGKSNYICLANDGNIRIDYSGISSVTTLKTTLSSNNISAYYVLATPTNTEITDTTLINQLEELYIAKSKENQTNISQINNDLGFIISASALKKG